MKVKINDTFPGESKGKTKDIEDSVARQLIANNWATEVKQDDKAAERETKEDKQAGKIQTK